MALTSESSSADFVNINLRASGAVLYGHRFNDVSLRHSHQASDGGWRCAARRRPARSRSTLMPTPVQWMLCPSGCSACRFPAAVTPAPGSRWRRRRPTQLRRAQTRWPKPNWLADASSAKGVTSANWK